MHCLYNNDTEVRGPMARSLLTTSMFKNMFDFSPLPHIINGWPLVGKNIDKGDILNTGGMSMLGCFHLISHISTLVTCLSSKRYGLLSVEIVNALMRTVCYQAISFSH